jgi:hypothetical protein
MADPVFFITSIVALQMGKDIFFAPEGYYTDHVYAYSMPSEPRVPASRLLSTVYPCVSDKKRLDRCKDRTKSTALQTFDAHE